MEDDGGSVLISNVDPELKAAQNKVRFLINRISLRVTHINIQYIQYIQYNTWPS